MKIRIKPDSIVTALLLLGLLNLQIYDYLGDTVSALNNILRVVAALGACVLHVKKKGFQFTPLFWWILLMECDVFIITLMNGADIIGAISIAGSVVSVILILESWTHDIKGLINTLMPLMELLCYANYLTVLLFPQGMYSTYQGQGLWYDTRNWLLGQKNVFITYLLPAYLIAFLYRQYGGKRWREFGIYIIGFISVALPPVESSTSTVGLFILFCLLLLVRWGLKFNIYHLAGINIAVYLAFVVFRVQYIFSWLITQVLGKSITFSSRTVMWDGAIELIKRRPLIGYGKMKSLDSVALIGFYAGTHAHNMILQYLYEGGVIQLTLYLLMLIVLYRGLRRVQESVTTQAIIVTLFAFQIMGMMEPFQRFPFLHSLYFFACFAKQIADTALPSAQSRRVKLLLKKTLITQAKIEV